MKKMFNKRGFSENLTKMMRIMRVTFFLVFVCTITISASTYSQNKRLSLKMQNATVTDVIDAIERQSEFIFFYQDQAIDLNRKVDINVKNAKIEKIMDQLLKGTSEDYLIEDRQIIIAKGKMKLLNMKEAIVELRKAPQDKKVIKGNVTEQGDQLVGVTVSVEGTTIGTVTDINGNYSLVVPDNATALVYSFIGMETQTVEIAGRSVIDVALISSISMLDEVIAVGYGSQRKRDVTGAISSVAKDLISLRSSAGATDVLQGSIAGVSFSRSTGQIGDNEAVIRIRGTSTLNIGADPLYVVDGVEVSTIGDINPDDIASMEVLKDAASASIYGSRSANGVILITTKRGSLGKPVIKANYQYSLNTPAYDYSQINLADWRDWNMARNNARAIKLGKNPKSVAPSDSLSPYNNTDNYLQDFFFQNGQRNRLGFNVSNATKKFSYYLNVDGLTETAPMITGEYKQINTRMNFSYKVSPKLTVKNNFSLSYKNTEGTNVSDAYKTMMRRKPGTAIVDNEGNPIAKQGVAILENKIDSRHYYNFMEQITLNYQILKNLRFESRANISMRYNRRNTFENVMVRGYSKGVPKTNRGAESQGFNVNTAWDNFMTYNPKIGGSHSLSAMLGSNMRMNNRSTIRIKGDKFPTDAVITMNAAGEIIPGGTDSKQSKTTSVAFFGRLSYDYDKRYLFNATLRRDGDSKFGADTRWATFPSASAAWRFSKEGFLNGTYSWLTDGKFRASWGVSGNSSISSTAAMALYNSNYFYEGEPGVGPSSLGNDALSWEETTQTNFGLDLTLFKGQLSIVADYYNKQTKDLLYPVQLPKTTGFSGVTKNIGKIENKGWELTVTGHAFRKREVSWDISLTLSQNKNKIIELADHTPFYTGADQIFYYQEGESMGDFYGWNAIGVYSYNESNAYTETWEQLTPIIDQLGDDDPWNYELLGYELNGQPYEGDVHQKTTNKFVSTCGDVIWEEVPGENGKIDGVIDEDDRQVLGNALPKIYGGLHNRISYKGLTFSFLFSFQGGNDVYGYNFRLFREGFHWAQSTPAPERVDWYWTHPGYDAKYPLANKQWNKPRNNRAQSSYWILDGSYIQLSNIRLDYRLPKRITNKLRLNGVSLFALVNNVAIWSNYYGGPDPTTIGSGSLANMGIDRFSTPLMRSYNFGLNLNF